MRQCIACKKRLPDKGMFLLEHAPSSAQNIPDAAAVGADLGISLELHQCKQCGLVQFDCTPVDYYRDVIRAGGYSTTMRELRRKQYDHLISTYHLEGKRFLEVGCGRGEFLKVLTEFPVEAFGIEHKEDLVEIAKGEGLLVEKGFPETKDMKLDWEEGKEPFDVFLSFNFLEHQPEPTTMLQWIYNHLSEDGMGLITVPAWEYIVERGSYYELIRDHIAYYSFDTLRTLLENCGFRVLEEEMINDDTISVIVLKKPQWVTTSTDADLAGIQPVNILPVMAGYEQVLKDVMSLKERLEREGKKLAIWGASHQGFTLASTSGIADAVEYMIDSAPFKQGRFAPASHLPIVAPDYYKEVPVDMILIVAPGYTDEIAGIIKQRFGEQVEILTLRTDRIEELSW